jgi:uncharacterized membrane protein HdeD (DUF308 family)
VPDTIIGLFAGYIYLFAVLLIIIGIVGISSYFREKQENGDVNSKTWIAWGILLLIGILILISPFVYARI